MTHNVGTVDSAIRIAVGAAVVLATILIPATAGWLLALLSIAVLAIGTALLRICPVYRLFGVSTHQPPDLADRGRARPHAL